MNYKRIEVPGQGVIEFPDSMSDEEIEKVIKEKFFSAPQEIITKRDQSTVRKAERQIRKKNLEVQAQEQHQKDVQNYLGEGGTVEKSYYQMSGEFYGTFGNMLSGVNRLARKVLGDTAVDAIESVPVAPTVLNAVPSGLTPIANILSATSAGKWLNKDHKDLREYVKGGSKDAKQVSSQLQGSENVAKVAGVAGQVGAFIPLAVTGPAAPYLTVAGAGVQSFDSTYDDSFDAYKRMGFGDDEADKSAFKVSTGAGLITGTVTGMFNKYGGKFFGGVFGKGVERGFSKPVLTAALDMARQGTMKQVAKNVLKEVTGEATEESIDQLLQVSLSYVSYRPDVTLQEAMWEVMEAGLLGGVGGGMGGGPFSVYQDLKYKKQRANIAYNAEVKARTDRSRQRYDGQQLQTLIDGGVDVEGNEVAANPTLANLKDAEGRVVVFSHQDVDVEGKPSDEKLGYVQLDENADIDAVVAHYEMENPNAHFRGAFDLSKKDGSKHFDGGVEETAADMDPDKMDIEERVETEVKALGDEVFDPVKLGKRRIRKADLEQLYGGSVSETDQGYSVKLDNGMQVDLNFDEKFFDLDTQEKIDQFEQSISAKMNIPLEEIQAMEPEARQEFRDQFTGAGANLQMQIDGKPVDGKFVQYFSRKADLQTAKHEAIHFLRQSGLVTEQEFNTLAERFAPDAKTEQDKEEAIAYAFEQYHAEAEERRQENRIGVFERVKNFFSKADVVDNVSGIFNAIERGEVARRAAPVSEPAKDLMEASDTLPAVTIPLPETEQEVNIDAEPAPIEPEPVDPQFSVEYTGVEGGDRAVTAAGPFAVLHDDLLATIETYEDSISTAEKMGKTVVGSGENVQFISKTASEIDSKGRDNLIKHIRLAGSTLSKNQLGPKVLGLTGDDLSNMSDKDLVKMGKSWLNRLRKKMQESGGRLSELTPLTEKQKQAKKEFQEMGWEAPRFKKWFGEGTMVDDNGNPKVFSHGSPTFGQATNEEVAEQLSHTMGDLDKFLSKRFTFNDRRGKDEGLQSGLRGVGIFLSPNKTFSRSFAGDDGVVHSFVTNVKKTFDYKNPEHINHLTEHLEDRKKKNEFPNALPPYNDLQSGSNWRDLEMHADTIKELGYDSYYVSEETQSLDFNERGKIEEYNELTGVMMEFTPTDLEEYVENLAVFDPSSVKIISTQTVGTFDASNYDVRYSVQDSIRGVNVNQGGTTFADSIVDGEKTIETRDSDSLRPVVGERIRIIRTGQPGEPAAYIGEVTVGEPKLYKNEEDFRADQDLHRVPPGNKFDIKEGKFKWGYPLEDAVRYEKEIIAPKLRGRVMTKPRTLTAKLIENQMHYGKYSNEHEIQKENEVREAAARAGYTELMWHGSRSENKRSFSAKSGMGLWLAHNEDAANVGGFEFPAKRYPLYVDLGNNPATLPPDAHKEFRLSPKPKQFIRDWRNANGQPTSITLPGYATVVFNPRQVKSAEFFTKKGKKEIPLEERFDRTTDDINFSVQLNENTIYIPRLEDPHVNLPHGKVENQLHELFKTTANPTSEQLSKILGSPSKRKDKTKLDKNVKPTSYAELRKMLEWGITNSDQSDWYDAFGDGFRNLVGDPNIWEAAVIFGITSQQNAAEMNYADTLHVMALARQHDPVNDPAGFEQALRTTPKPEGHGRLKIQGSQIKGIINFYKTGIKEGGLKTTTYMQMVHDRGFNIFNPFSVQDVHMSRAFGYRYTDVDKDTDNVVDAAKFPSDKAIRYGMYLTTKLANEYNMRPDQVQALIWFYAKSNLSPKKVTKGKKQVGDGTFESANRYAQPEIAVIESMKSEGTFDSGNPYNRSTGAATRPSSTSSVISDPWSNSNLYLEPLLKVIEEKSPNLLVDPVDGNERGFGLPAGATLKQANNLTYDIIESITDGTGNIKFLNSIGVPHTVSPVVGVGSVNSPGIELTFTGSTLDSADRLAPVMGDAMLADKVSVSQPIYGSDGFGMKLNKPDNSPFSKQELAKMHKLAGRNFTITQDGTGIKILDDNFYKKGKKYAAKDLDIFVESLKPLIDGAGLSVGIFSQKGKQYEHSGYQEAVQETWSKVPPAQRSDIQRSAVDELYKPIWTTYQNFFQKNKLKPVATKPAPHLDIQFSVQNKLSPEVEARINSIEGAREIPKDEQPKYEPDLRGKWAAILGRPSSALGYVGGPDLLRDKNELMLESAYQAKAVNKMTNDLQNKMLNDAYASVEGWKFPKWMKVGKWSKRLKQFQKDSLPIAAHLNATARDSGSGEFTFADFDMRAGMMPVAQFKKAEHKVGDVIEVSNPLSGEMEFLTIGGFVNAQGRVGYQLTRKMTAEMQTELYNHYKKEYADMIWLVEMFIDPNLKGMTKEVGGVRVPLFNRFSLEEVMKQTDEDFEGIAAYTPDVLATRTLKGIVDMVMNPTKVGKVPGRKYKTGKSRESGNVRDLLTGFNIRTFQAINESANKHFAEMVFEKGVEAMPKEGVPNGYVKLDRGIEDLMGAIKAYRYYENPQPGEPGYSEAAARLSELDNPENYSALLGEAYKRKGGNYIIRKDLVKLLTNKFSHSSQQNRFMRMINWGIRNSTQGFLIHPYSYVVNMLTNDYFAVEASFHRGFRGMAQILSKQTREMGKADLDHAGRILGGMFINRAAGIRQLMGFKTQYDQVVENILPDEVFENSTALADLKVSYDTGWFEYLKQGEIGAAGLQAIKYGDIDLRPKQRLAFAYLKSQAVRRAKKKGLTGKALKDSVDSYLLNPPKEDRIEAVNQAQFEFLNYADSPQLLQDLTKHDVSRLILQYPRFGYHYMHKQADRLKAVKDVFGRNMPPGKRADALAHFVTFATFTGGLGGMALHYALKAIAGDDEDDSAQYIGNYQIKYKDPITGEVKTKKIDYSMITSNRINLSKYFEAMGIGDGDGEDFWWRVRNYPMIAMAGAAVQATEDTKKFGIQHGLATYFGMAKDLGVDMTTIGSGLKVGSKALASMKSMDSGRPERPFFDPYGATVPFSFYITESAMSSLVPFKRQFDEVSLMIDPIHRRRTASRQLNYEPGPWEAIRQGHAGGAVDRILTALGAVDPLPPGGKVENVSKSSMSTGQTSKSRATRREAKQKLDTSHAGQYYDTHGNLRLGVVPEANIRKQEGWQTAAKMGGFNLKQIDRRLYLDQLGPPKKKKSKFKVR